jgi:hypothetical protein
MVSLHYELSDNRQILCFEGAYTINGGYENVYLRWDGGGVDIGDHYGHPTAAIMDVAQGWCVTAGEGLEICHFERGFPGPGRPVEDFPFRTLELWRHGNPPPDGQTCWFVEKLWFAESELDADGKPSSILLHVLVDPGGKSAGLYEVDVVSLAWRRI